MCGNHQTPLKMPKSTDEKIGAESIDICSQERPHLSFHMLTPMLASSVKTKNLSTMP